ILSSRPPDGNMDLSEKYSDHIKLTRDGTRRHWTTRRPCGPRLKNEPARRHEHAPNQRQWRAEDQSMLSSAHTSLPPHPGGTSQAKRSHSASTSMSPHHIAGM